MHSDTSAAQEPEMWYKAN